jgi:DNA-binding LacI/PurR family transcriptional regulator
LRHYSSVPATIRDVARAAGVSIATVSHAHSGNRPVSERARRRVVETSRRLGYRPSHLAQAMVTGRSKALGLIVPDIANPFFPEIGRGAEDAAADRDYGVFLADSELDPVEEQRYVDAFRAKGVDGLLYLAGTPMLGPALADAAAGGTPLVLVDEELPVRGPRCGFVGVDNAGGGRFAAEHLLERGCRRPAVVGGPARLPTAQARLGGFLSALADAGVELAGQRSAEAYVFEDGVTAGRALLGASPRPDGIFCANDLLAFGVASAAREAGLSIPHDVAVVGFDNIFFARLGDPPLTTVAQPMRDLGAAAANLLIDLIEGRPADRRQILPVHLIERASTRPKGGRHGHH